MKPMTVYVLCWTLKEDHSCWDIWGVYADYGTALANEESLQEDYPDRWFSIYSDTLNEEIYENLQQ